MLILQTEYCRCVYVCSLSVREGCAREWADGTIGAICGLHAV